MPTRNQVFISYAREDVKWRDEFTLMLSPAVRRGSISLWSDANIPIGADWARSIESALGSASVGLMLVTPHFLDSEFINNDELTRLLNLAKTAGVALYWVPVSRSLYTQTPLESIQAAWDPEQPLDQLSAADRSTAIHKICTEIVEQFGFLPKVTGRRRENLPQELQQRLGNRYELGEEIGSGRFSIVYRAQQKNPSRTVAVKLFVASEFDEWALEAFDTAVKRGADLTSPAFIRIIDLSMDANPEFLITEFVKGESLSKYMLHHTEGAPLSRVKSILLDLIRSLEELHEKGWIRGELCASNVLIEPNGAARLSTVDLSAVLSEEALMAGTFSVDRESLAYMTPERFFGRPQTPATDQFALGLIATELLGGEQVPRVNCPSDLEGKRQLFHSLETGAGRWSSRSSELSGVVSRLLRTDPLQRWPSMTAVRHYVQDIAIAETEEDRYRSTAKRIYLRLQAGGRDRVFFEQFYGSLFDASDEVAGHFSKTDMQRQHTMLNRAIQLLLDYCPATGSVQLRDLSCGHSRFALGKQHYDLFLDLLVKTLEQSGEANPDELLAWRRALAPGVEFMRTCQAAVVPGCASPILRPAETQPTKSAMHK